MATLAKNILTFYKKLNLSARLPEGVTYMNPYKEPATFMITSRFYEKFYGDENERSIILGINPGRFGGGITGIPFTDPINLDLYCKIDNPFARKPELSSTFIYQMINAYGGVNKFYGRYLVSALSPLGFVKDGKNLNYYDIRSLQEAVEPFIVDCIRKQLRFNINRNTAYCLGEGENFKVLSKLNKEHKFFDTIIPLAHPRFIMQYKRKHLDLYIGSYLKALK